MWWAYLAEVEIEIEIEVSYLVSTRCKYIISDTLDLIKHLD